MKNQTPFVSLRPVFNERTNQAEVTQLVESQPSKLLVAGSSPVFRSKRKVRQSSLQAQREIDAKFFSK